MKIRLFLSRYNREEDRTWTQQIVLDTAVLGQDAARATVATALTYLNAHIGEISDTDGHPVKRIAWDCGCLQKRCGACAMVIDGRPRLACDARLSEFADKGSVTIGPLKKFPLVEDLIVDRSVMRENLARYRAWLAANERKEGRAQDRGPDASGQSAQQTRLDAYEGSRCLQCGLCLEVCPNFYAGGEFFGTALAVPAARLLALTGKDRRRLSDDMNATDADAAVHAAHLRKGYRKHIYEGCGKSLACRNICPAGIHIDELLARNVRRMSRRGALL
ncbi:MAG: succinate dehydrogenase [Lachnospiraceae bacterium]|nr:succinate dehydrogenase [Lachnospiraceae bacterium]